MVHAFYVLSKKTIANRNFQRFSLLEVLYFYHYNCEAFQENFCVLYMTWFNVFFFFRDIQWFQHYLLQIFFFSSHWIAFRPLRNIKWSYMHRCSSGFTILFCWPFDMSVISSGPCCLDYRGFTCCCSVAKSCPLFATPRTAPRQASLSSTVPGVCSNSHPWSQWCRPTT